MLVILILCLAAILFFKVLEQICPGVPIFKQLIFIVLWLIIGLRYNVGTDYPAYAAMYDDPSDVRNWSTEPIWYYINGTLRWFGFKSRMYFLVTSGFTMFCFYKAIKHLSPSFYISILIFILIGFYFETANVVRQFCAMGALFWGYTFLVEKKWFPTIILFALGICLHYSAAFGILILLFSVVRINRWLLLFILTSCILLGSKLMNFIIQTFMPIVSDLSTYNYTVDQFYDGITTGTLKYIYGLLSLMLIIFNDRIESINALTYRLINLTVYGVCLYCVFYTFQPARRLFMYGFMFSIIAFPYFFKIYNLNSRWMVVFSIGFIFMAFLVKQFMALPYSFDIELI